MEETPIGLVFLVASNFMFLLPFVRAMQMSQYPRAFIYMSIVFVSSFYHVCKPSNGLCILPFEVHWFMDFSFAIGTIPTSLLFLVPFGAIHTHGRTRDGQPWVRTRADQSHVELILIFLNFGIIAALLMRGTEPSIGVMVLLAGANLLFVGFSWLWLWQVYALKPVFDWTDTIITIVLATVALPLYFISQLVPVSFYWLVHSIWHSLGAVSQFYLLETRTRLHSGLWQVKSWPVHQQSHQRHGVAVKGDDDDDLESNGGTTEYYGYTGNNSGLPLPWGIPGHSLNPLGAHVNTRVESEISFPTLFGLH